MSPVSPHPQVDESVILEHYRRVEGSGKKKLSQPPRYFTLTNTALGLGDTLVLSHLPRVAAAARVEVSIHSPSPYFAPLMKLNPYYKPGIVPFWVSAEALNGAYDLGNGHFIQRLQRAYGFEPELVPHNCLVVPRAEGRPGRVALHFEPGGFVHWQRKNVHPRAREVYPENMAILQRFILGRPDLKFFEIGSRFSGLEGVEDRTNTLLEETIWLLSTCEYFVGILSGPLHMAAALGVKIITLINFPEPQHICLPVLKNIDVPETEWLYPQSVVLHQDGESPLVPRFSLETLEGAFQGEIYPYWSDRYLPLIHERL